MRSITRTDATHTRTVLLGLATVLSLAACGGTGDRLTETASSIPAPTATVTDETVTDETSPAPPTAEESGEALPAAVDPALFPDADLLGRVGWQLSSAAPTEGDRPVFGWPCEAGTDAGDFSAPDAVGHQTWPVSGFTSGANQGVPGTIGFDVLDYADEATAGQALDDYTAALGACVIPYPDGSTVTVTGPSDLADPGHPQHYDTAYVVQVGGPAPQGVIVGRVADRLVLSVYATDPGGQLEGLDVALLTESLATSVLDTVLNGGPNADGDASPFPANTDPDLSDASGAGSLTVTDIRMGGQDGFDRIVFELGGPGTPGWDVEYVERATAQGTGDPIDIAGDAVLRVTIIGTSYPEFTGIEEYVEPAPLAVAGTRSVVEEVFNGTFEGTTVSYVGTTSQHPFRVYSLSDPTRVVVEVAVPD